MNFLNKIFKKETKPDTTIKTRFSDNYLFAKHDRTTIIRWNENLKYGFYKRAWGGHANDGDEFGIWLKYNSKTELFKILNSFGIELKRIPENYTKAVTGVAYSCKEYEKFKSEIKDFPEYEQPLHIEIDSIPCYCWIEHGKIDFTFSGATDGNRYEVSENDFNNCLTIESIITKRNLEKYVSNDFENHMAYISKKNYVDLFEK